MDVLSIVIVVIVLAVVGNAWLHFRSNWRDVQSMRGENKASADLRVGDFVEGPNCTSHHGHGHEPAHQGGDAGGHDSAGFHGGDHGGFDGGGVHH